MSRNVFSKIGKTNGTSARLHVVRLIVCSFPQQPFGLTGAAQDPKSQQLVGGDKAR